MPKQVPVPIFTTALLKECMKRADMTVSDLAVWFERPRATVRTWAEEFRVPIGPSGRAAARRLELLQIALCNHPGLPVPETLSWKHRAKHIAEVRDASTRRNTRVPAVRASL